MDKKNCDLDVIHGLYRQSLDGQWSEHVVAYHITQKQNVSSIIETGLLARPCRATERGEDRNPAVYLFASRRDAYDSRIRDFLFDDPSNTAVIKVKIPFSAYDKLHYDGLFNMSCICSDGSYPTGVRFADDIPADWIEEATR